VTPLWDAITREATEADRAMVALDRVYAWAAGNEFSFQGRNQVHDDTREPRLPRGEWFGKWEPYEHWDSIAFLEPKLRKFLADEAFDVDAILRTWLDRGWLITGPDASRPSRISKKVRIGNGSAWAVVVKREAFNAIGG
jgi:hypothetical protein